jgi:hypothetical protein
MKYPVEINMVVTSQGRLAHPGSPVNIGRRFKLDFDMEIDEVGISIWQRNRGVKSF